MSRKSFRKSRGRKTRSTCKRTMGGAGGGEVVEALFNTLAYEYLNEDPNEKELRKANMIETIKGEKKHGLLSNNKSCRTGFFSSSRDKDCEAKKAKYYFAAAELVGNTDLVNKNEYKEALEEKAKAHVKESGKNEATLQNDGKEIAQNI